MKTKTSITLSPGILSAIDAEVGAGGNRSQFIEDTLKRYFRQRRREERDRRDAEIYSRYAAQYAAESVGLLQDSVDPLALGDEVEVLVDEEPVRATG